MKPLSDHSGPPEQPSADARADQDQAPQLNRVQEALERIVVELDGEAADGNIFPAAALRIAREALSTLRAEQPEQASVKEGEPRAEGRESASGSGCSTCNDEGKVWLGSQPYGSPGQSDMPCPDCSPFSGPPWFLMREKPDSGRWQVTNRATADAGRKSGWEVVEVTPVPPPGERLEPSEEGLIAATRAIQGKDGTHPYGREYNRYYAADQLARFAVTAYLAALDPQPPEQER